jgi:hypothetical protein
MNPPAEQLIRDYLNRVSVAARGRLGFSERQSLLDRTRARIEAECSGANGASAVKVRKALADLGDPIVLVELEANQAGGKTSPADTRYDLAVAGNGYRGMAAGQAPADEEVKGSEIGEDLLVSGGPSGSKPGRGGSSIRSVLAGLTGAHRRRRRAAAAGEQTGHGPSRTASGAARGAGSGRGASGAGRTAPATRLRRVASSGQSANAGPPTRPTLVPAPRRPAGAENAGSPVRAVGSEQRGLSSAAGQQASRFAGPTAADAGLAGRFISAAVTAARDHIVEALAIVLLGVGGAVYPPIWLIGVALAIPSKVWDKRDKTTALALPVLLSFIGAVLTLVFGGQHATIQAYAFEAWLGAERISRVLALAGAVYLAWRLHRGRRHPKLPAWNVPHRLG